MKLCVFFLKVSRDSGYAINASILEMAAPPPPDRRFTTGALGIIEPYARAAAARLQKNAGRTYRRTGQALANTRNIAGRTGSVLGRTAKFTANSAVGTAKVLKNTARGTAKLVGNTCVGAACLAKDLSENPFVPRRNVIVPYAMTLEERLGSSANTASRKARVAAKAGSEGIVKGMNILDNAVGVTRDATGKVVDLGINTLSGTLGLAKNTCVGALCLGRNLSLAGYRAAKKGIFRTPLSVAAEARAAEIADAAPERYTRAAATRVKLNMGPELLNGITITAGDRDIIKAIVAKVVAPSERRNILDALSQDVNDSIENYNIDNDVIRNDDLLRSYSSIIRSSPEVSSKIKKLYMLHWYFIEGRGDLDNLKLNGPTAIAMALRIHMLDPGEVEFDTIAEMADLRDILAEIIRERRMRGDPVEDFAPAPAAAPAPVAAPTSAARARASARARAVATQPASAPSPAPNGTSGGRRTRKSKKSKKFKSRRRH